MRRACALLLLAPAFAQERVKPLDPAKARINYAFPVRTGAAPLRFRVQLNPSGEVTGLSVFRSGDAAPFQNLPTCKDTITEAFTEYEQELDLLEHADLNFDGFEDLKLMQAYSAHLGTKVFCFYTWDNQASLFRSAPDIPGPNPVPHLENKTLTVHQDWFGGDYADSTWRWTGAKFELVEEFGRVSGSDDPKCGFTDHCEKRIAGKMVTTLSRGVVCSDQRRDPPLVCPATRK